MAIREKTPRERAAMHFKTAGLGDRSAEEAARLMFEVGLPFESAAVVGQRIDEESTATTASIREAANRWSHVRSGPRAETAWGRPIAEVAGPQSATKSARSKSFEHPEKTRVIEGVLHHEVVEYEPVTGQEKPTRTPWGRPIAESKES